MRDPECPRIRLGNHTVEIQVMWYRGTGKHRRRAPRVNKTTAQLTLNEGAWRPTAIDRMGLIQTILSDSIGVFSLLAGRSAALLVGSVSTT